MITKLSQIRSMHINWLIQKGHTFQVQQKMCITCELKTKFVKEVSNKKYHSGIFWDIIFRVFQYRRQPEYLNFLGICYISFYCFWNNINLICLNARFVETNIKAVLWILYYNKRKVKFFLLLYICQGCYLFRSQICHI